LLVKKQRGEESREERGERREERGEGERRRREERGERREGLYIENIGKDKRTITLN
jgi:hypothetical protein